MGRSGCGLCAKQPEEQSVMVGVVFLRFRTPLVTPSASRTER